MLVLVSLVFVYKLIKSKVKQKKLVDRVMEWKVAFSGTQKHTDE